MPVDEFHRDVAAIALRAAGTHGFALGGGNALIAHGIISRPTEDVDLFTNEDDGVKAAAGAVGDALREAGYGVERQDVAGGLADVFDGIGDGLAEWIVTAPDGAQMMLQMAYFDRGRLAGDDGRRPGAGPPGAASGGRDRVEGLRAGQPGRAA